MRRVYIPKPDGRKRPLDISTIRDRVAETAAVLILSPIFEADLQPEQYAYRQGRNAHDAVRDIHRLLNTGYRDVVDADLARHIRARLRKTEVLIFTTNEDETVVAQALQSGVRGYLLKSDANRELIAAIEALVAHKPFFTAKVSDALLRPIGPRYSRRELALSPRERQIVQLIAEGYSSKRIAKLLNIGLRTVDIHRAAILRKLNLSSSAALVRYAVRNKIVEP